MNNETYPLQQRRPIVIDGIRRPSAPRSATPQSANPPRPRTYHAPQTAPAKESRWKMMQLPLLLLAGTLGGFFAETLAVGLAILAAYGVMAFVTRIPSRTTFTLTLLLLGAISAMLLLKPSMPLIQNFATYAFVLLMIGVITLGREARMPKRTRRKYRR